MAVINTGGLENHAPEIFELLTSGTFDVIVSPETRITSTWTLQAMARPLGITVKHLARQRHTSDLAPSGVAAGPSPAPLSRVSAKNLMGSNSPGGGVAILSRPGVSLTSLRHDPRGALSVCGTNAAGCPFAIIGVYVPPATSGRKEWRAPLLAWIGQEYKRLRPLFSTP